jgi:hypothetical protein
MSTLLLRTVKSLRRFGWDRKRLTMRGFRPDIGSDAPRRVNIATCDCRLRQPLRPLKMHRKPLTIDRIWRYHRPLRICRSLRDSFGAGPPFFFAARLASRISTISFACSRVSSLRLASPPRLPISAKYSRTWRRRVIRSELMSYIVSGLRCKVEARILSRSVFVRNTIGELRRRQGAGPARHSKSAEICVIYGGK